MDGSTDIQQYLDKMAQIHELLLEFIDAEEDQEESYTELISYLNEQEIKSNKDELKSVLYIIINLCNYHLHTPNFFSKIEQILTFFKNEIQQHYSNIEIFNIFKSNKRVLLFLFEEKILTADETIKFNISRMDKSYHFYFYPEIQELSYLKITDDELEEIKTKRKTGENDSYICSLIRDDLIDDFVSYVNRSNTSLKSTIQTSNYETNIFLIDKNPTLTEYAAFFGSLQIFNFLRMNKQMDLPDLMTYAIHGQNADLIHIVEEKSNFSLVYRLRESIKCHNNKIAYYIRNHCFKDDVELYINVTSQTLEYYNFSNLPEKGTFYQNFTNLCRYDYFPIIKYLYMTKEITDPNRQTIYHCFFLIRLKFKFILFS